MTGQWRPIRYWYSERATVFDQRARESDRLEYCQAVFGLPIKTSPVDPVRTGYGEGALVVLSAEKLCGAAMSGPHANNE